MLKERINMFWIFKQAKCIIDILMIEDRFEFKMAIVKITRFKRAHKYSGCFLQRAPKVFES